MTTKVRRWAPDGMLRDAGRGLRLLAPGPPGRERPGFPAHLLKAASERDLTVGGPALGTHAITPGLVDEYHLFVWPVVLGGGKPFLPDRARFRLELLDERRLGSGVVELRYRTQP